MISLICGILETNKQGKHNRNRLIDTEKKQVVARGERDGEIDEIFFQIFNLWNEIGKSFLSRLHRFIYKNLNFSSVQLLSHVQLFVTPGTATHKASLSINNSRSLLRLMSTELVMPSNHLILCCPLLFPPSIFPALGSFPMSQFFASGGQVLVFQLQHQSFQLIFRTDFLQDGLVGSPCNPRDSQESSTTPQFKSIISSALSFLCSPTLIYIHDCWKNHNFDQMDLCWQS